MKYGVHSDVVHETFKNRFSDTSLMITFKNEDKIFSSLLNDEELHLTFRTERQFDLWGTGLKVILDSNTKKDCSKKNLLWHCRLFRRFYNN